MYNICFLLCLLPRVNVCSVLIWCLRLSLDYIVLKPYFVLTLIIGYLDMFVFHLLYSLGENWQMTNKLYFYYSSLKIEFFPESRPCRFIQITSKGNVAIFF